MEPKPTQIQQEAESGFNANSAHTDNEARFESIGTNSKSKADRQDLFTFEVDNVEPCKRRPALSRADSIIQHLLQYEIQNSKGKIPKFEDHSHRNKTKPVYCTSRLNGFLEAVHTAYAEHYHLQLSVSDFIILIGQGLSKHINNHKEKLRKNFVDHEGKDVITIVRNDFVIGKQNDWSSSFGEFAEQIKKKVKLDLYDVFIDDTSVATPTTKIVSEITLMDSMKGYFEFKKRTGCGIPTITLKGLPEDWEKLRNKVRKLVEMNKNDCLDLNWWLDRLVPVVEKICDAGEYYEEDQEFWKMIYKFKKAYMSCKISGWIMTFFPYIKAGTMRNDFDTPIETNVVTKHISDVPLEWIYYEKSIQMRLCGGFLGAKFNEETFTLKPACFWSVTYADEQDEKK